MRPEMWTRDWKSEYLVVNSSYTAFMFSWWKKGKKIIQESSDRISQQKNSSRSTVNSLILFFGLDCPASSGANVFTQLPVGKQNQYAPLICQPGFRFSDFSYQIYYQCLNGQWSPTLGTCQRICIQTVIQNGNNLPNAFNGQTATVTCTSGIMASDGSTTRTYTCTNGQWGPKTPENCVSGKKKTFRNEKNLKSL